MTIATVTLYGAVGLAMLAGAANAAEIRVIGSPGTREPYNRLVPEFEKATGNKVTTTWGGVIAVAKRVAGGETADVVMLPAPELRGLVKRDKVRPDSFVDVATAGVGVVVKAGAPKVDIGSAESLKKALLAAKSIAYSAGPSGIHMEKLIRDWGIYDTVKSKIVPPRPNVPIGEVVAAGDAEIGFQQVSELLGVKGVDYLGPLPPDIQELTVFSAGVHTAATAPEAGRALLRFLTAPEAGPVYVKTGMEPGRRGGPAIAKP